MKKLLLLLTVVVAFACTSVAAQYGSSSSSGQTSTDQTATSGKKSKKSAGSSDQMGATSDTKGGKAKKESTLTGCLNESGGNYMLSNGKFKKGVQVEPADKVKDHAGHQVQLSGQWAGSGADKKFEVASVKHISETCSTAPGGGTTGATKKGKKDMDKGKDAGAAPKQ